MSRRPRVLVLNNYDLRRVSREVAGRHTPDHVLFGVNHLESLGWEVEILPQANELPQARLGRLARLMGRWVPLGDLRQQQAVLDRPARDYDLVFAPCQTQTNLLALERLRGRLRRPVVALAHHPLLIGRARHLRWPVVAMLVRGHSAYPALSRRVAAQINRLVPGRSQAPAWGPDRGFYQVGRGPGEGFLMIGRTARDLVTFGKAASQAGVPATLVTLKRHASEVSGFAPCVRVVLQPDEGWDLHSAHLPAFAQARAICIPLVDVRNLAGLTSVMDALGAGRPMLLTRHPLIDLDVDGLGIGRTIPVGDVDAWAAALRDYQSAPERAAEEGARARALVDSGLNSVRYAGEIDRILKGVLASSGTAPP